MTFDKETSCCFTGHRVIPSSEILKVDENTETICKALIKKGFKTFIAGGAKGFDTIAAQCVLRLRTEYDIKLVIAVPCRKQSKGWGKADKEIYDKILHFADEVIVLSEDYTPDCMHKRNRFMVDNSAVCVAYLKKMSGGTAYTVNYAADEDREIIFV